MRRRREICKTEMKMTLIKISNDEREREEIVNYLYLLLTVVNVAEILIQLEICIYLPAKHHHNEDGNVLIFTTGAGKINGNFHYMST